MLVLDWGNPAIKNAYSPSVLKTLDPWMLKEVQRRIIDFCNNCSNRAIQRLEPRRVECLYGYFIQGLTYEELSKVRGTSTENIREVIRRAYACFSVYDMNQNVLLSPETWAHLHKIGFDGLDGFCKLSGMHFETPESRVFKAKQRGYKARNLSLTDRVLMEVNEELRIHGMQPVTYVLTPKEVKIRIAQGIPFRDVKTVSKPTPTPAPTAITVYYG